MNLVTLIEQKPLNPFVFSKLRSGTHQGRVNGQNLVYFLDHPFQAVSAPLKVETLVIGYYDPISKAMVCRVEESEKNHEISHTSGDKEPDSEATIADIVLPCAWVVAQRRATAGINSRSWGDGRSLKSLNHVRVAEGLAFDRYSRKAGEFLCRPGRASSAVVLQEERDSDGSVMVPVVTCDVCKRIAKKYLSQFRLI